MLVYQRVPSTLGKLHMLKQLSHLTSAGVKTQLGDDHWQSSAILDTMPPKKHELVGVPVNGNKLPSGKLT